MAHTSKRLAALRVGLKAALRNYLRSSYCRACGVLKPGTSLAAHHLWDHPDEDRAWPIPPVKTPPTCHATPPPVHGPDFPPPLMPPGVTQTPFDPLTWLIIDTSKAILDSLGVYVGPRQTTQTVAHLQSFATALSCLHPQPTTQKFAYLPPGYAKEDIK